MPDMVEWDRKQRQAYYDATVQVACDLAAVLSTHAERCRYGTDLMSRLSEQTRAWIRQHTIDDQKRKQRETETRKSLKERMLAEKAKIERDLKELDDGTY